MLHDTRQGLFSVWYIGYDISYANNATGAPSQYPKRRLSVRSRKVSKPRDLYLELSDRSEIWQALRQQCCRCACQISKRYDNLKYQSRGFESLRDLTKRRLFGYWDGAQELYNIAMYLCIWVFCEKIHTWQVFLMINTRKMCHVWYLMTAYKLWLPS